MENYFSTGTLLPEKRKSGWLKLVITVMFAVCFFLPTENALAEEDEVEIPEEYRNYFATTELSPGSFEDGTPYWFERVVVLKANYGRTGMVAVKHKCRASIEFEGRYYLSDEMEVVWSSGTGISGFDVIENITRRTFGSKNYIENYITAETRGIDEGFAQELAYSFLGIFTLFECPQKYLP